MVSVDRGYGHICIRFPSKCNLSVEIINRTAESFSSGPLGRKEELEWQQGSDGDQD